MNNFLKQTLKIVVLNWREIVGWIVIGTFAYLYLFKINNLNLLANREWAFGFLVVITILILAWLKINKSK